MKNVRVFEEVLILLFIKRQVTALRKNVNKEF